MPGEFYLRSNADRNSGSRGCRRFAHGCASAAAAAAAVVVAVVATRARSHWVAVSEQSARGRRGSLGPGRRRRQPSVSANAISFTSHHITSARGPNRLQLSAANPHARTHAHERMLTVPRSF